MLSRVQWWVLGSGVLMVVGAFGPWATVFQVSIRGTDGSNDGWLVVAVAAIGGGLYYVLRRRSDAGVWPLLAGLAGLAVTVVDRQDLTILGFAGVVHVGWGLNLALAASISMALAGVFALVRARRSAPAPTSTAPTEQAEPSESEASQWPPAPGWERAPPPESPDEDV